MAINVGGGQTLETGVMQFLLSTGEILSITPGSSAAGIPFTADGSSTFVAQSDSLMAIRDDNDDTQDFVFIGGDLISLPDSLFIAPAVTIVGAETETDGTVRIYLADDTELQGVTGVSTPGALVTDKYLTDVLPDYKGNVLFRLSDGQELEVPTYIFDQQNSGDVFAQSLGMVGNDLVITLNNGVEVSATLPAGVQVSNDLVEVVVVGGNARFTMVDGSFIDVPLSTFQGAEITAINRVGAQVEFVSSTGSILSEHYSIFCDPVNPTFVSITPNTDQAGVIVDIEGTGFSFISQFLFTKGLDTFLLDSPISHSSILWQDIIPATPDGVYTIEAITPSAIVIPTGLTFTKTAQITPTFTSVTPTAQNPGNDVDMLGTDLDTITSITLTDGPEVHVISQPFASQTATNIFFTMPGVIPIGTYTITADWPLVTGGATGLTVDALAAVQANFLSAPPDGSITVFADRLSSNRASSSWYSVPCKNSPSGLVYFEMRKDSGIRALFGIGNYRHQEDTYANHPGGIPGGFGVHYYSQGTVEKNATNVETVPSQANGEWIGCAYDSTNGNIFFQGGTFTSGTHVVNSRDGIVYAALALHASSCTMNLGATPFAHAIPASFSALAGSAYPAMMDQATKPVAVTYDALNTHIERTSVTGQFVRCKSELPPQTELFAFEVTIPEMGSTSSIRADWAVGLADSLLSDASIPLGKLLHTGWDMGYYTHETGIGGMYSGSDTFIASSGITQLTNMCFMLVCNHTTGEIQVKYMSSSLTTGNGNAANLTVIPGFAAAILADIRAIIQTGQDGRMAINMGDEDFHNTLPTGFSSYDGTLTAPADAGLHTERMFFQRPYNGLTPYGYIDAESNTTNGDARVFSARTRNTGQYCVEVEFIALGGSTHAMGFTTLALSGLTSQTIGDANYTTVANTADSSIAYWTDTVGSGIHAENTTADVNTAFPVVLGQKVLVCIDMDTGKFDAYENSVLLGTFTYAQAIGHDLMFGFQGRDASSHVKFQFTSAQGTTANTIPAGYTLWDD